MSVPTYSEQQGAELEDILDQLYAERARALDKEATWNVRNEAWVAIDGLLDVYNLIVSEAS